jgi:hypothetical protein
MVWFDYQDYRKPSFSRSLDVNTECICKPQESPQRWIASARFQIGRIAASALTETSEFPIPAILRF